MGVDGKGRGGVSYRGRCRGNKGSYIIRVGVGVGVGVGVDAVAGACIYAEVL